LPWSSKQTRGTVLGVYFSAAVLSFWGSLLKDLSIWGRLTWGVLVFVWVRYCLKLRGNSKILKPEGKDARQGDMVLEQNEQNQVKTQDFNPTQIKGLPSIPFEIAELVWFSDGPLQNYDASNVGKKTEVGYGGHKIEIHAYMTTDVEPSAISTQLMVKQPKNPLLVKSLPYSPRYGQLTPEQRWIYLHWLIDIEKPIAIGYVFLYYYGLERHLFLGLHEQAFRMIVRLRRYHSTSSFPRYSANALLASILFHKRLDLYTLFAESSSEDTHADSDLHLYVKYLLNIPITPEEIVQMASISGFKNTRYIKAEYSLFCDILSKNLQDYYGIPGIPWNDVNIDKVHRIDVGIVANTSLSPRNISIPKLSGDKQLSVNILNLLQKTHEDTKNQLKILRKEKSYIKVAESN
jgi:hypothetical protein